jgi:hypothetical protein
VSATEGESALTEWAQRQRGNERLQGSEGVRAIRSRSDGENQTGNDERLRVTLISGSGRQVRVREAVPAVRAVRSKSDGGVRPGKQTTAGGAAPLHGGEVAGVETVAS